MNSKNKFNYWLPGSLVILFILVVNTNAVATHIIGGEMSYKCLGNDNYEITWTIRRDCELGADDAQFDSEAILSIFSSDTGERIAAIGDGGNIIVPISSQRNIDLTRPDCTFSCGNLCVEEASYKVVISLPFLESGYTLAYQRCCRNSSLNNITNPLNTGGTWFLDITAAQQSLCNSSPAFGEWPDVAICINQLYTFQHAVIDDDGDSLAYRLYTPHGGASESLPKPRLFDGPPFAEIEYSNGFSLENMMASDPPLTVDPVSGLLSITPEIQGQFLVGVLLEEWRDGILLSETRRNFEFNVCISNPVQCAVPMDTFTITNGESIDLMTGFTPTPGCVYDWDPSVDLIFGDSTLGLNPIASPTDTTIYDVIASNGTDSIPGSVVVIVINNECPAPRDTFTICVGQSVDLMTGFSPTEGCSYLWSPSNELEFGNPSLGTNPVASPLVSTTYMVTATDGFIEEEGAVTVFVVDLAQSCNIEIVGADQQYCAGIDIVEISATTACTNIEYNWSPSGAVIEGNDTGSPIFNIGSSTEVTLTITDSETGCSTDTTFTIEIADPSVSISATPGTTITLGETVTLTANTVGDEPFTFEWDTGETTQTISPTPDEPGTHTYTVIATDANGCESEASITITVEQPPCSVGLPNAFTPNGDGVNDEFVIRTTRNFTSLDFQIVDRWGGSVFESRSPSNTSWDGTLNGRELSPDVYAYCAIITCEDGMEFKLVGNVTLLR